MANSWSESEVEAAVADYFEMLRLELTGHKYNKTQHRRALIEQLNNRSHGSVELKHQNISAVLIEMGMPYIDGYKPRANYQRSLLPEAVSDYIAQHPELQQLFAEDSKVVPEIPTVGDLLSAMESAPEPKSARDVVSERRAQYFPTQENYLELEARNQALGDAGEQFVINFERARLIRAGKEKLADRIEQVSTTVGPSAGFDILSFDVDGRDRFIEAKTTKYGKETPFYVTPNELAFSRENGANYFLYRVFKFRADPRLFALHGVIEDTCALTPSEYMARPS